MRNLKKLSRTELNNIFGNGTLSSCTASCPGGGSVSISCEGTCIANDGFGVSCGAGGGSKNCPQVVGT